MHVITDTYLDAEQNADVTQWQAKKRFVVYLLSTTVSKFIVHGWLETRDHTGRSNHPPN